MDVKKIESRLTPREVAHVLFRQWRKIALVFGSVCAFTLVLIAVYPRSYLSESKLFIRIGRESVGLDPTATTGQTINLQKSQTAEINSAMQILSSRALAERVVERLGSERILDDLAPSSSTPGPVASCVTAAKSHMVSWISGVLKTFRLLDGESEKDLAIRRLEGGLKAVSPKESTIITVSYMAASPQLAHDVVEAVTDAFLERHLELNHSEGSLKFFSEQADKLHDDLIAAQTELRDRKNEFQVTSADGRRAIVEQQIRDVELELLSTQRNLAFSEAKVADLARAIDGLKPEVVTNRVAGIANVARDQMREKLYELELEESKLRARFKNEHPLLLQVQRQRQQAEAILAGQPNERTQTTEALNQNQLTLDLKLLQERANGAALRARQMAAESQRNDLTKKLKEANGQDVQLAELERNVLLLDGKYRRHVEKLEEARVNDALGRDGITNVKVAQPATLVEKPASPKKSLLLVMGLATAVAGAFCVAYLAEALDQTLRTTEQVENALGLPVLLSLPYRKRGEKRRAVLSANGALNGSQTTGRRVNGDASRVNYAALINELARSNGNGHANGNGHTRTVGIVGCETSKLRSRVAAELAIQAARSGVEPVLLIDADARQRRIARRFRLDSVPGLRELLAGIADVGSCVHRSKSGKLAVMAPGLKNGHEAAGRAPGGKWAQLDAITTDYGLVVVDLPSEAGRSDTPAACDWLDEMVLVIEAERTRVQAAQRAKETLERAGVRVSGVVLANRREHIPSWLYRRL